MHYKAVFFDRDGTLTYANPIKIQWRDATIREWSDHKFVLDYEKTMALFTKAGYPEHGLKSIEEEKSVFLRYYEELLLGEGVIDKIPERAQLLFSELWCNNDRLLFDEVIDVLEFIKGQGCKLGVISDTSPSLQLTLEQLGLGKYFESYTCSSLVGAMKPDPIIYNAALVSLNVKAEESIYVDDYDIEADGARDLGFLSFHIDRTGNSQEKWAIKSLREMVTYASQAGPGDRSSVDHGLGED